jgi:hypothetical protein
MSLQAPARRPSGAGARLGLRLAELPRTTSTRRCPGRPAPAGRAEPSPAEPSRAETRKTEVWGPPLQGRMCMEEAVQLLIAPGPFYFAISMLASTATSFLVGLWLH